MPSGSQRLHRSEHSQPPRPDQPRRQLSPVATRYSYIATRSSGCGGFTSPCHDKPSCAVALAQPRRVALHPRAGQSRVQRSALSPAQLRSSTDTGALQHASLASGGRPYSPLGVHAPAQSDARCPPKPSVHGYRAKRQETNAGKKGASVQRAQWEAGAPSLW